MQLTLYSGMLSQFQNLIMREPVHLWVPVVPLIFLDGMVYKG